MKRFVCWCLCLCLLCTGCCFAWAEDPEEDIELSVADLDEIDEEEDYAPVRVTGKVYPEPTAADFDSKSPALYKCKIRSENPKIFKVKDMEQKNSNVLYSRSGGISDVDVLYVGLRWLIVRKDKKIGYVLRQWVEKESIKPADPVNTQPFNVQKHAYTAVTATACHVRKDMSFNEGEEDDGNNYVVLNPGTRITVWKFYDGWAVVNYWREYGYIDPNELTDLKPVSPTDEMLYPDCPIGAYTSYYKMVQIEQNLNRIYNIKLGCGFISVVINPGEEFNANKLMGRYNAGKGYKKAGVLVDGRTTSGYGGGTCQVSSTLYNVVVQLPKLKIIQRRAHGGSGASYLPIHCDAAVGNSELNQRWINNYPFPIRIEACSNDDGALCVQIYRAD